MITENEKIIGYAHLDQTDLVAGPAVELVVDPDHRQSGIGNQLTPHPLPKHHSKCFTLACQKLY